MCVSGIMTFKRLVTIGSPSPLSPQTEGPEVVPAETLITFFHGDGEQEVQGHNSGAPPSRGEFSLTPYHTSSFPPSFLFSLSLSF